MHSAIRAFKFTDATGHTRNHTRWLPRMVHAASGTGELCGSGWIHCYADPLLAALLNPIHAKFRHPLLWECAVRGPIREDQGLKIGVTWCQTLRQIPLPVVALAQRQRWAILCAQAVIIPGALPTWEAWAERWLSGEDRSTETAWAAAASMVAAGVAWVAAMAARAAAVARSEVAATAATVAAGAVAARAEVGTTRLDLLALAQRALQEEPLEEVA